MRQLHLEGDSARRSVSGEANPEKHLVAPCFSLLNVESQVGVGLEPAGEQLADRIDSAMLGVVRVLSGGVVVGVLVPEPAAGHPLTRVVAGVLLADALEILLRCHAWSRYSEATPLRARRNAP